MTTIFTCMAAAAFANYMDYEFGDDIRRYNAPLIVGSNNLGKSRVDNVLNHISALQS